MSATERSRPHGRAAEQGQARRFAGAPATTKAGAEQTGACGAVTGQVAPCGTPCSP